MLSTPFVFIKRDEKISKVPTDLEVALSFLAGEYFRRKLGGKYEYFTRAMIPFVMVQITPANVVLFESFTEKVDQLKMVLPPISTQ